MRFVSSTLKAIAISRKRIAKPWRRVTLNYSADEGKVSEVSTGCPTLHCSVFGSAFNGYGFTVYMCIYETAGIENTVLSPFLYPFCSSQTKLSVSLRLLSHRSFEF